MPCSCTGMRRRSSQLQLRSVSWFSPSCQWLSGLLFRLRLYILLSRQCSSLSVTSQKELSVDLSNINWLAIFVASLSSFIIGAVWFGPKTFYPIWVKFQGRTVPTERVDMSAGATIAMFGGTYLAALIQVSTLGIFISLSRSLDPTFGAGQGALTGALLGFGIGAAASLSHRLFAQSNHKVADAYKVWIIEVGQDIVCLTVAGLIIGAWA